MYGRCVILALFKGMMEKGDERIRLGGMMNVLARVNQP
jgi:hypothetical protein